MPPKPPIRIPSKPWPISKSRFNPPQSTKSVPRAPPRSQTSQHTNPPPPPPPSPLTPWRSTPIWSTVKWTANTVVFGCALLWIRDHYIDICKIDGVSMAPSINPTVHETGRRDWVIVRPYLGRAKRARNNSSGNGEEDGVWGEIKRGDVVTFWKPHKPEESGIKRVVAVEGDTVYPKRGYALEDRGPRLEGMPDGLPSTDPLSLSDTQGGTGKVIVPYGHVWVEGDNSRCTLDSRDVGPISKSLILGKAVWIWRDWMGVVRVGDERGEREKKQGSRVEVRRGMAVVPDVFLE